MPVGLRAPDARGRAPSWSTAPQPTDHTGASSARSGAETNRLRSSCDSRTLSYSGRKRTGAGVSRIRPRRGGKVEELAAALVAEGHELRPQPLDHRRAGRSAGTTSSRPRPTQGRTRRGSAARRSSSEGAAVERPARATPRPSSTEPGRSSSRGRAAAPARAPAASGRRRRALPRRASEIAPRGTLAARSPSAAPRARAGPPRRPDPDRRRAAAARSRGAARAVPRRPAGSAGGAAGSRRP